MIGKTIEPVIKPLGFDWKIGIGLIGSFAAREVFVSTLGVVYGIEGASEDDMMLRDNISRAVTAEGKKRYRPLVGISLMVFFAIAMQCVSTLAVLKRESGSWKWPAFVFGWMTALAWVSSFVVYQVGSLLGY